MNRLLTALVAAAAVWAAACSSGNGGPPPPPPAGNFTLASLSGTYAFTTSGEVCAGCTVSATPMARAGSFTADGKGNITGGIYDVVTEGGSSATVPITSGSNYKVDADGRGTLTFMVTSSGGPTSISFAFVLTSGSSGVSPATDGIMIDETATGLQSSTGSGNFVLQATAQFQIATVSGSYVFDFAGFDGNTASGPFPESLVGEFAASGGAIRSGLIDDNDGTALTNGSMIPGTLTADPTNMPTSGRGTAVIEGQSYAFYIVNSNQVRFISSNGANGGPMLSGDAVLQTAPPPASVTGSFAFLVAGSDANSNGITRVGRFTVSGNMLTKMLMDVNDASNEVQFGSGLHNGTVAAYDPASGRGQITFQDSNGQAYTFVFYLSSANGGVLQDVSPSSTAGAARVVADGSISLQTGGPFSSSNITGTYALNWSGVVTAGGSFGNTDEEDVLSQLKVSSLSLSGTSDAFQFTSPTLTPKMGILTSGTITLNGDGTGGDANRVNMNVTLAGQSAVDMVVYIVNPRLAFFANRDNNGTPRIVAGVLQAQQ